MAMSGVDVAALASATAAGATDKPTLPPNSRRNAAASVAEIRTSGDAAAATL
jgi:hypothetical protein